MAFKQKWAGFENRIKAEREENVKRKLKQQTPHKVDRLTVQRLSSNVSEKAQNFSRIGPREFVSYPYVDLTFEGIKKTCKAHFLSQLKMYVVYDVLAGEFESKSNHQSKVDTYLFCWYNSEIKLGKCAQLNS